MKKTNNSNNEVGSYFKFEKAPLEHSLKKLSHYFTAVLVNYSKPALKLSFRANQLMIYRYHNNLKLLFTAK